MKTPGASLTDDQPDWLAIVRQKVESLRYGVVQIAVHDRKVTQIECTERTRLESTVPTTDSRSSR